MNTDYLIAILIILALIAFSVHAIIVKSNHSKESDEIEKVIRAGEGWSNLKKIVFGEVLVFAGLGGAVLLIKAFPGRLWFAIVALAIIVVALVIGTIIRYRKK